MIHNEANLSDLLENKKSIEAEIRTRVSDELRELDARRAVLLDILGGEERAVLKEKCSQPSPKVSIPKYQDPATGKTWSGKGKRPMWFDAARADDFLMAFP